MSAIPLALTPAVHHRRRRGGGGGGLRGLGPEGWRSSNSSLGGGGEGKEER